MQILKKNVFLVLHSFTGKLLIVFRIYFFNCNVYESTQKSSVSNESLVSEWRCAISVIIYTGYGKFYVKREYKQPLIVLYWLHVDMIVFA